MRSELAKKECLPSGGEIPLEGKALIDLLKKLDEGWMVEEGHLEKEYRFDNFRQALDFTVKVGEIAEAQEHYPDLYLAWGKVVLNIWTHEIDGLTESDFILAAKTDEALPVSESKGWYRPSTRGR